MLKKLNFNPFYNQDREGFDTPFLNCFEDVSYEKNPNYAFHATTASALEGIQKEGFKIGPTGLGSIYFSKKAYAGFDYLKDQRIRDALKRGESAVIIIVDLEPLILSKDQDLQTDEEIYRLRNEAKSPPIVGYCEIPEKYLTLYGIL